MHCIVLHCIALHCMALYGIALHCITLHYIALHCIALHCIALHCIALHCIALEHHTYCPALHCTELQYTLQCALHCITLQWINVSKDDLTSCAECKMGYLRQRVNLTRLTYDEKDNYEEYQKTCWKRSWIWTEGKWVIYCRLCWVVFVTGYIGHLPRVICGHMFCPLISPIPSQVLALSLSPLSGGASNVTPATVPLFPLFAVLGIIKEFKRFFLYSLASSNPYCTKKVCFFNFNHHKCLS